MASDLLVSKRLHISGLTPSITPADLQARLSAFGTVTSVEGFDKLDGLGRPRGFGYVSIEGKEEGVRRCMAALSGTMWKGAKLRIGEAKPDFQARLERHRTAPPSERPKKRLARDVQGVHADDMTPITRESAKEKKGWRVSETGRMVRVVKMRPERPLGLQVDKREGRDKDGKKEKKAKARDPPKRARKRVIDPMRWGSVHLKGAFLGEGTDDARDGGGASGMLDVRELDGVELSGDEDHEGGSGVESTSDEEETIAPAMVEAPIIPRVMETMSTSPLASTSATTILEDIMQEKKKSLDILQSLFGDKERWGSAESIGSDVDMGDVGDPVGWGARDQDMEIEEEESELKVVVREKTNEPEAGETQIRGNVEGKEKRPTQVTKLKDLFAPREEAGFSLLGHLDLDLDLELEDDIYNPPSTSAEPIRIAELPPASLPTYIPPQSQTHLTFEPNQPLFFPLSPEARAGTRGKVRDVDDVFKERGWDWQDGFYRTETEEEIRKGWEESKVELTRDWKRRHREGVKSRRRMGGGDGGE